MIDSYGRMAKAAEQKGAFIETSAEDPRSGVVLIGENFGIAIKERTDINEEFIQMDVVRGATPETPGEVGDSYRGIPKTAACMTLAVLAGQKGFRPEKPGPFSPSELSKMMPQMSFEKSMTFEELPPEHQRMLEGHMDDSEQKQIIEALAKGFKKALQVYKESGHGRDTAMLETHWASIEKDGKTPPSLRETRSHKLLSTRGGQGRQPGRHTLGTVSEIAHAELQFDPQPGHSHMVQATPLFVKNGEAEPASPEPRAMLLEEGERLLESAKEAFPRRMDKAQLNAWFQKQCRELGIPRYGEIQNPSLHISPGTPAPPGPAPSRAPSRHADEARGL